MRALLATAAVLLALPSAAAAAPTPGDYGGGRFGPRDQVTWMWARLAADGTLMIGGRAHVGCAIAHFDARAVLAPDGTFSVARSRVVRELGHVIRSSVRLRGRFDGALAIGTIRARARDRLPSGRVQRCGTGGARGWKLHLSPGAGPPAGPQAGGKYLGLTSQAAGRPKPFLLRVNARASRVQVAIFDYAMQCRRGILRFNNFTPGRAIAADGTFVLRERFTLRWRGGIRERFRVRVDGRFTAGGVTGTLRVRSVARRDGRVTDRCGTGVVAFNALL